MQVCGNHISNLKYNVYVSINAFIFPSTNKMVLHQQKINYKLGFE